MANQSALGFLIDTVFNLYLMVVLLRIWMQLVKADFYNPLSQFVVKLTHPVVGPLRRVIPPLGNVDTASVLFAYVIACAKVALLLTVSGYAPDVQVIVVGAGITLLKQIFSMLFWILVIRAILSWVSQGYNPIEAALHQLTEPMLAPIRRVIPSIGGLDLSVVILLIGLQFLQVLIFQ
ncbi:YggT family protein [Echinimonas agarilytica]|uniref:YggT family protein n=1 Tax=Echinimonas agarilytica TaxID=1215918 RepID=A0AA42B772_9GAMM|nr:YggT family protein [Echinimonas agarilytica]MCM2678908.1 YggT family protein [Echinimonas agarilytica]